MHTRKPLVTGLLLIVTASLFASNLSLEQALSTSRANNGDLKVANLTLKKTLREGEENIFLPSISLNGGLTTTASIADSSISTSYSVGSVSFTLSSTDKYAKEQMTLASTIGQNTYQSTLNTVESLVTTAYWNLASQQLVVQNSQIQVEKQQRYLQEVENQYENGLATTMQVNQAKLALYDSQLALQTAQQDVKTATDSLNLLMGTEGEWVLDALPIVKEVLPLDSMLALLANTTAAKSLAFAIDEAELMLKNEKNTALSPTVSFQASTSLSGSISSSDISLKDSTKLAVSVSVPLDSYLKNSAAQIDLDSKEYAVLIAQAKYNTGISTLNAQVKASYAALQQAKANLEKLNQHQQLAEDQLQLVQASYEGGQSTFNELQDSIAEVQSANLSVLAQNLAYTLSLYNLAALLEVEPSSLIITK
ncbi:outer membrane protein [Sphaerochaeta pleomorpha str. Grapes]|uniref:Outer membrane protein n=1 Tax=Sphaerochaeta pleomorpha (strain ATCC BAA-1885 / DSM 22778 / Grapes) TaxID=158190 RepID=G8QQV7_SPHPG|nr:TolC family protein [Sphaerochaeta pleomorpha]AEV28738.1 outer membrane protein [Sphaerochaeta pleomorpha str. Grapes]